LPVVRALIVRGAGSVFEPPVSGYFGRHHQTRRRLPWNRSPTCSSCSSSHLGYASRWVCSRGCWSRGKCCSRGAGGAPGSASTSHPRCDVNVGVAVALAHVCPRMPLESAFSLKYRELHDAIRPSVTPDQEVFSTFGLGETPLAFAAGALCHCGSSLPLAIPFVIRVTFPDGTSAFFALIQFRFRFVGYGRPTPQSRTPGPHGLNRRRSR
jgi:hypothetical protein